MGMGKTTALHMPLLAAQACCKKGIAFHSNFLCCLPPLAVSGITPSNKPAAKSSLNEGASHSVFAWGSSSLVAMGVCGKDNGLDVYEYGIRGLYMCKGNAGVGP